MLTTEALQARIDHLVGMRKKISRCIHNAKMMKEDLEDDIVKQFENELDQVISEEANETTKSEDDAEVKPETADEKIKKIREDSQAKAAEKVRKLKELTPKEKPKLAPGQLEIPLAVTTLMYLTIENQWASVTSDIEAQLDSGYLIRAWREDKPVKILDNDILVIIRRLKDSIVVEAHKLV